MNGLKWADLIKQFPNFAFSLINTAILLYFISEVAARFDRMFDLLIVCLQQSTIS